MRKTIRIAAIALAGLLALLIAGAAILAATFDPNDYKPLIIRLVQEKKQRTLAIPGDIKPSFFPKIGADLGKVSISEHGSPAEFASVERANVSLALIPLLSRQLVVDQVRIDGLRATIRLAKDGSSNVDDLMAKEETGDGKQVRFDIDGVHLTDARIVIDDRQQGRRIDIDRLSLDTGKIAAGVPGDLKFSAAVKATRPEVDAAVSVKTRFTFDLEKSTVAARNLDAQLKGAVAEFSGLDIKLAGNADLQPSARRFALDGIKLSMAAKREGETIKARIDIPELALTNARATGGKLAGELSIAAGSRVISATFAAPSFEGSPKAFRVPSMALDTTIRDTGLDAKAKTTGALAGDIDKLLFTSPQLTFALSGKQGDTAFNGVLTTPLSINLAAQTIDLPTISADLSLPNPAGGTVKLKLAGNAAASLGKKSAAARLGGNLDGSAFTAKLGLSSFSPLMYTFDVGIDALDIDRYRSTKPPAKAEAKATAEQPMDFSALQKLHAAGSVRVGALKAANIRASNVRFDLRAADGRLAVSPIAANLYGGSASGAVTVTAARPARFAVRQVLSGISVGPLLKDATGKDPVEGKGNVQLDVTAAGATVDQIKKALNGSARLELRDGSIRGVNIAQTVRNAKATLNTLRGKENGQQAQTGTGSVNEKTDFSELTGSFRIVNGVAHNEDLNIKSPLIRVAGAGQVDLGAEHLDYLARTTVVSTLQGQGGPELQSLKGLTVPVRLAGPFAAIGWRIDVAGMASELAKQQLDERKGELKEKAKKSLDEQKEKVRDQLRDQLKGLLGR